MDTEKADGNHPPCCTKLLAQNLVLICTPLGMACCRDVYWTEKFSSKIRRFTPSNGMVLTVAGASRGGWDGRIPLLCHVPEPFCTYKVRHQPLIRILLPCAVANAVKTMPMQATRRARPSWAPMPWPPSCGSQQASASWRPMWAPTDAFSACFRLGNSILSCPGPCGCICRVSACGAITLFHHFPLLSQEIVFADTAQHLIRVSGLGEG